MKVLVATKETQGERKSDFFWTEEGEYVYFGFECCNTESCGCSWSFSGMKSRKGTTTAKVIDASITKEMLVIALRKSHAKAYPSMDEKTLDEGSVEDAERLLKLASLFEVGAVLRRGAGKVHEGVIA